MGVKHALSLHQAFAKSLSSQQTDKIMLCCADSRTCPSYVQELVYLRRLWML